jgi:hypothetical protein
MEHNVLNSWHRIEATIFPSLPDNRHKLTPVQFLLAGTILTAAFSAIGFFIKPDGFIGFDWYYYYSRGIREPFYPPWMSYVRFLTWPGLVGVSYAALTLALYQRRASPLVMGAAFLSLPSLWVLFLGQLDGVVLLGLTAMPWLVPLAMLKPQLSVFAFLARKEWTIVLALWLLLTMLIWGLWPLDMLQYDQHWKAIYQVEAQPQNISLWPWALPLSLVLHWLSRGDMDMLMLAGSFAVPHLIPYNYLVVLPTLARVNQFLALALVGISYMPLLANWVGPWGWYLGHLFAASLWVALFLQRHSLQAELG